MMVLLLVWMACASKEENVCPDATCDDYLTQGEAQAAFDADRDCLQKLDHDDDEIACEHVFDAGTGGTGGSGSGSGTGGGTCPTTANCGCSNKNKDVCESACCKWVVGSGCQCK